MRCCETLRRARRATRPLLPVSSGLPRAASAPCHSGACRRNPSCHPLRRVLLAGCRGQPGRSMQADSRIELWLVDLARCAPGLEELERNTPRLADDDRERAGGIRDRVSRRERVAAYIALRIVLERAAGAGVRRRPLLRPQGGA